MKKLNNMSRGLIILSLMLLIPTVSAIENYEAKTVIITGEIDSWIETTTSPNMVIHLIYSGLYNNDIIFTVKTEESTYQIKYNYNKGMNLEFPLIIMSNVVATESSITYREILKPETDEYTRYSGIPGFEMLLFLVSLISIVLVIEYRRKKKC